jgi:hypothetical protein
MMAREADLGWGDPAMTNNRDQFSSAVAAAAQTYQDGFIDRTEAQADDSAGGEGASPRSAKKPYRKPTYRYERVFETMALACGKVGPVEFQCRFNRKNS